MVGYREIGIELAGFDAANFSDIPSGAGLSSSAAGGSTVSLVHEEAAEDLKAHLENACEKRFGTTIEPFITGAAEPARILDGVS